MANGGGSFCTIKKVIWTKAFNRGFSEAREGIAMDYDAYAGDVSSQWSYERGRLFGFIFHDRVKYGKEVSYKAIAKFADAYYEKSMI